MEQKYPSQSTTTTTTFSLSDLTCQETEVCLNEEEMEEEDPFFDLIKFVGFESELENEYVEILLQREKIGFSADSSSSTPKNEGLIIQSCRLDAINYILSARAALGYQFQTAYLSVTYFDRFLSRRTIDSDKKWPVKLLSVACLSLAAKLEEYKVPTLSDLLIGDFNFECKVIQRMELLVLNTLEWKLGLVTPFAFLPYFIHHLSINNQTSPQPSRGTMSRTIIDLILAILRDVNWMDHLSSGIACAAVLVALDHGLTRTNLELMINVIPSSKLLNIEDICTCYTMMQKLQASKITTLSSKLVISPDLSPFELRSIDVNSLATTSSGSTKRKRLAFDDRIDEKDDKRQC